jgi:hypothetical protein
MDGIDWTAPATLHARHDAGPEGQGPSGPVREGALGELVRYVALLSAERRAHLTIEVAGGRTLDLGQILELAAREDLGD